MTNQSTIDKFIEMRLTSMADAFRNQLNDPEFKEVAFKDSLPVVLNVFVFCNFHGFVWIA